MCLLSTLVTLASPFLAVSAAFSVQANNVLTSISAISEIVQANEDAITRYQGGTMAAILMGRKATILGML
ncbi:uncharacterized protein N7482_004491 [Penicillium canariense]|uniref:Uncharacterized protein n=1 Tax=Penicillium canariense TaxID=189055 RepID=A0A9W9LPL9_9EURO|nr:uncharacterized protein N7482_004491 [Penicillium canariense]KAJ5168897.1 hypothetical protein N7482_004491 [Penicillium canariense]